MTDFTSDAVELLTYLLPGFTAAWLFYGLTSHQKPTQFERVVQALIFTFVIQVLLQLLKGLLISIGSIFTVGVWSDVIELSGSFLIAIAVGAIVAYFTNSDSFHKRLRQLGFTSRTSHPSEWFCAFTDHVTYVILHLKDGRRLYGWPKEWPIDPQRGQFYIQVPSWIDVDGKAIDLPQLDGVLIHVEDVDWVEFMRHDEKTR
ncbi:MAG TPA: DUF6338 family protein [Arenimonas sp.]|uniref:DUF6338 family protein n=1 Tax=Arenimonas sp. TaxID=1872635 RepID=UPI002D80B97C|nr:DUF6338 family protein [Arenimonas sp.]HEU0153502.1 DUF6338 family protein [Arenimonas sp.]